MRRSNTIGNWIGYLNNNGSLFNQTDSNHLAIFGLGAGGLWTGLGRFDTVIFGEGLWFGGLRDSDGVRVPHSEFSYNPNTALSEFAPGSLLYDGAATDTTQAGRDKYRVYLSSDLVGPAWPLRLINGSATYVDDPALREAAGPKAVFGDQDMFLVYKDSDPDSIANPFGMEVRTDASFWNSGLLANVVVVQNEVIYSGSDTVFDPVVAVAVDGDINYPYDDRTKGVQDEGTSATVFFTNQSTTDPLLGVMVLQGQHGSGRPATGVTSIRYWDILQDPATDSARYAFLTEPHHDTALSKIGDARILLSSLSHTPLVPGDTIDFDYALFVQPPTGAALTPRDSASMLSIARMLLEAYRSGSMSSLAVDVVPHSSHDLEAYPNPADESLRVLNSAGTIALYDVLGRKVASAAISRYGALISTKALPEGTYLLRDELNNLMIQIAH